MLIISKWIKGYAIKKLWWTNSNTPSEIPAMLLNHDSPSDSIKHNLF